MAIDEIHPQAQIEQAIGWSAVSLEPMDGATSSAVYAVRGSTSEGERRCVLRLFDASRWPEPTAELTAREARILQALSSVDVATPQLLGTLPGNGVLMSLLPGRVQLPRYPSRGWLRQLAEVLTTIHASASELDSSYASWNDHTGKTAPAWWPDATLWRAAQLQLADPPGFVPVTIHRDYHPVNVLWEGARISGVVDWINACRGPAGVDVAHCRLNLALMYDLASADGFCTEYLTLNPGYRHHPFWDIDDAFSALPEPVPYPPWEAFGLLPMSVSRIRRQLVAFIRAAIDNTHPTTGEQA